VVPGPFRVRFDTWHGAPEGAVPARLQEGARRVVSKQWDRVVDLDVLRLKFKNPEATAMKREAGGGSAMINKRGQKPGSQRGDRRRFPYEPRVVGGKLRMPAELQAIHR
jgi:hypothetical protein